MMIRPPLLLLSLCFLLLSGCVPKPPKKVAIVEFDASKVTQLIQNQHYANALLELEKVDDSETIYADFHRQINEEIPEYEKQQFEKSNSLLKNNQLYDAQVSLDYALKNIPHSERLITIREKLVSEKQALIKTKKNKILLEYAQYRIKVLEHHQQIARWESGNSQFSPAYIEFINESEKLADQLIAIANNKQSEENSSYAEIKRYFKIAADLSEKPTTKDYYAIFIKTQRNHKKIKKERLKKQRNLKEERKRQQKVEKQRQAKELAQQVILFKQNINNETVIAAKKNLSKIEKYSKDKQLIKQLKHRYKMAVNKKAQVLYQKGAVHYSREKYQLALSSWQQTLELNPAHTMVKKNIKRVKKIIKTLQQLKTQLN